MITEVKVDPRDPIEASWRAISQFDARNDPNRLAPGTPKFVEYAWDVFDTRAVIEVISSDISTYKALKSILFSGLCTWVVCPNDVLLRQAGMLLIAIEHLLEAEAFGRAAFAGRNVPNQDLLGDIIGKARGLGQDFYVDFYYPIGGLYRIVHSTPPDEYRRQMTNRSHLADIVAASMQVFDFHARFLNDEKLYYPASFAKTFELIRRIHGEQRGEIGIGFDKMELAWKSVGEQATMIYAASTIPTCDSQSLLDVISSGTASFDKHGHLLNVWIRRALYTAKSVLMRSTKPEMGHAVLEILPDLPQEIPPEPKFSEAERAQLKEEFDRAAILGNRRPEKRRVRLSRRGPRTA